MKQFRTAAAVAAMMMIMTPIALETQPVAFFQTSTGGLVWYAIAFGLVGLAGR